MIGGGHCECHTNWDCGKRKPEVGTADYETVMRGGRLIAGGYLPLIVPGQYAEVWEYDAYIYILLPHGGECKCSAFGLKF